MSEPVHDGPGRLQAPVKVKICGITTPGDAVAAIEAGADALGFNGFRGSKRWIDLHRASEWIAQLPPLVTRVAVLVNPTLEEAEAVLALPGIDLLQFHGDETPDLCDRFAEKGYLRAFAARDRAVCQEIARYRTRCVLLDAFVPGAYGGTGQLINLELAAEVVRDHRGRFVFLSGGLQPENVAEAVAAVRPYAVDVASGVESAPGRKDRERMRAFIAAAKGA
ncbi:MAG TPA: phosphoribosylanthranilate isomerase [Chthoniobacteraceae bacterium]|nr:phosphoribosylanthranilate isomerase [Chthoniobacteraceae bacterium]